MLPSQRVIFLFFSSIHKIWFHLSNLSAIWRNQSFLFWAEISFYVLPCNTDLQFLIKPVFLKILEISRFQLFSTTTISSEKFNKKDHVISTNKSLLPCIIGTPSLQLSIMFCLSLPQSFFATMPSLLHSSSLGKHPAGKINSQLFYTWGSFVLLLHFYLENFRSSVMLPTPKAPSFRNFFSFIELANRVWTRIYRWTALQFVCWQQQYNLFHCLLQLTALTV